MDKYSFLNAAHTAYFADLYDQYLKNPDSVEPSWRAFFQGYDFGSESYGMEGEIIEGASAQVFAHQLILIPTLDKTSPSPPPPTHHPGGPIFCIFWSTP